MIYQLFLIYLTYTVNCKEASSWSEQSQVVVGPSGDPCYSVDCPTGQYCETGYCHSNCKYIPRTKCDNIKCTCEYRCVMVKHPGCFQSWCPEGPLCIPSDEYTCETFTCNFGLQCFMLYDNPHTCWPFPKCIPP